MTVSVVWPKEVRWAFRPCGRSTARWCFGGHLCLGEVVVEANNSWPLAAIGWGLALGAGLVLMLRLQSRHPLCPKIPTLTGSKLRPRLHQRRRKNERCLPRVDRRLRVPVSYAGSVGCPDCSHKFAVEASCSPSSTPDSQQADDEVEVVNEQPEPFSQD